MQHSWIFHISNGHTADFERFSMCAVTWSNDSPKTCFYTLVFPHFTCTLSSFGSTLLEIEGFSNINNASQCAAFHGLIQKQKYSKRIKTHTFTHWGFHISHALSALLEAHSSAGQRTCNVSRDVSVSHSFRAD